MANKFCRLLVLGAPLTFLFSLSVCRAESEFLHAGTPIIAGATDPHDPDGDSRGAGAPPFAALAKELSPAVVNISVESDAAGAEEEAAPGLKPQKKDDAAPLQSVGSGFFVSDEGYVVTSNHVIDKAEKIVVRQLDDKTEYPAKVIGKDAKTDIALLKISAKKKVPYLFIGDSDQAEVGEWVMAIGNQFQLGQTVTAGIISAKSRRVPTRGSGPYDQFIQTDASINPGSSGGPLIDHHGRVIGINTAIFSPGRNQFGGTGFNIGIGFAIPMNLAKGVLIQLKAQGKVTRGVLGVLIQPVTSEVVEALQLGKPDGALVSDVLKDSPASKAGFKRSDVILSYNGQAVRDHDDLPLMVANTAVGSEVKIEVLRDGKPQTLNAKIDELKDQGAPATQPESPKPDEFGLVLQSVTEDIAKALELEKPEGALVAGVEPNSLADRAGFIRGDVIEEIDRQPVVDLAKFKELMLARKKDKASLVLVRRKEGTRFLTLKSK